MNNSFFSPIQKKSIQAYLSGSPKSLGVGYDASAFANELEVNIYEIIPGNPVRGFDDEIISKGRFYRLTHFAIQVLAAIKLQHDRYGIFGEPRSQSSVDMKQVLITKKEWDSIIMELKQIILDIEPDIQFQFDPIEFLNRGPTIV